MSGPPSVIVVGGGAAGLMAAIHAAQDGARVLVLERNPRPGKKILVSGNGRCNLTNVNAGPDTYTGTHPHFARSPLSQFDVWQTLAFFEELGLEWREEAEGRVFPLSNQATSVLELLEYRMTRLGIEVETGARMQALEPGPGGWTVRLTGGAERSARCVVFTPGSNAYPQLGTTGDGYEALARLGYALLPTYPSLVPMFTSVAALHRLQGIRMQVDAIAHVDGRPTAQRSGEVLFTAQGISGPVALWLSGPLAPHIHAGRTVTIRMNLMPGKDEEAVDAHLGQRWDRDPDRTLAFSFVGLLPRKFGPELVTMAGADPDTPVGRVSKSIRKQLARLMTDLEVPIHQLGGLEQAEVAGGGVATEQVSPRTMESRLHPGLFLAGEILDVHGDWGGYNFQFAWSTGQVAGSNAAATAAGNGQRRR